jgi:hypothetical protein
MASFIFQNGREDFVDLYSLKKRDLLVFEYKGNSKYSVFICKEMDCPAGDPNSACCERVGSFEEGMEDGDYLEFLAKFSKEKSEVSHSVSKSESDSRSCINTFLKKLKMSLYIYIY